jgi:hypothetical protein
MPQEDCDDRPTIQFMNVDNEALLAAKHDEIPIYIKCTLPVGHFIVLSTVTVPSDIGQLSGSQMINITHNILSTYAAIFLFSL